jgi:ABC-type dipeptide/oligopeptide/nickel transport system ATPase component
MNQKVPADPILQVRNLETHFKTDAGVVKAVDRVSFDLHKGETLGIVGESGSGKSVTNLSLMRLIPSPPGKIVGGQVMFHERDLMTVSDQEMRSIRGNKISMIFQDPMTSLNPFLRVSTQLIETIRLHQGLSSPLGSRPGGGDARDGRDPEAGGSHRQLPAPVLRGHATARHDRDGPLLQAGGAHRR